MVHTQTRICPGEWDAQNSLGFWDTNRSSDPSQKRILKIVEHEGDTNCNWCARNGPQRLSKGAGTVGNQRPNWDYLNYSIFGIKLNIEKSPGDSRRLAVAQWKIII